MMPGAKDLPIRPSEAAALADAVFQAVQEHRLSNELRDRLADRIASLDLRGLHAFAWSLAGDPLESSGYYIAADALPNEQPVPVLLHFALASAAGNGHFRDAVLLGRLRPGGGREIAVSAIPFAPADRDNIAAFVQHVERAYLPRPQAGEPSISADLRGAHAGASAAFEAFRTIFAESGWNAAAAHLPAVDTDGDTAANAYFAQMWAAIRAGWREGYGLEADRLTLPADAGVIARLAGYTGFSVDASPLLDMRADHRSASGWSEPDIMRLHAEAFAPELRSWAESEFARKTEIGGVVYTFAPHEIRRLVVKFGQALLACEAAFDLIAPRKEPFDFEIAIDRCETLTTAKELIFCMQWMKARGRSVQSIAPNVAFKAQGGYPENMQDLVDYTRPKLWIDLAPRVAIQFHANPLAELTARVAELSTVARQQGAVLGIYAGRETQAAAVQAIGRATNCVVHYKLPHDCRHADCLVSVARSLRS